MEHRLILGGEQYLPFARSRIKALRAAGQCYAGRRWIMPGGEVVAVRIEGEHEYIRLEGGNELMAMDSGVIDLKGYVQDSAGSYENGTRYDTDSTSQYTAGWSQPAAGKWAAWRGSPTNTPFGQFAGTVEAPGFRGHVHADSTRAESFEAEREPLKPTGWAYATSDSVLAGKKAMVHACPASNFTGRCRLYVQALYGRHLYSYASDESSGTQPTAASAPSLAGTSPPKLFLPPYLRPDDAVSYGQVLIDTSAGVRFDAVTGRHWLMIISGDTLVVYPLLSSKLGERMRAYLAGGAVGKSGALSDGDREKLEAYVLGYCRPDVKNAINVSAGAATPGYSMGYGWHWNWSGTCADIVTSSTISQGTSINFPSGSEAMVSTHRRLTVNVSTDGAWSASREVVEGPSTWSVDRTKWCIAGPEWGSMSTIKSTPQDSLVLAGHAPFYAFYNRDALVLCRMAVEIIPATDRIRVQSAGFSTGGYGTAPEEFTPGMLSGFCEDQDAITSYFSGTASVGDHVEGNLILGKSATSARWDVGSKAEVVPPAYVSGNDQFVADGDSGTYEFGYEPYAIYRFTGPGVSSTAGPPTVQFTRETSNILRTETSWLTVVVPFHDAEAIFMQASRTSDEVRSGRQVSIRTGTGFVTAQFWTPTGGAQTLLRKFIVGGTGGGTILSSTTPDPTESISDVSIERLDCRAGSVQSAMGNLDSFHNAENQANVIYIVMTGAANGLPVVISVGGSVIPVGVSGAAANLNFPALVGWV